MCSFTVPQAKRHVLETRKHSSGTAFSDAYKLHATLEWTVIGCLAQNVSGITDDHAF